MTTTQTDAYLTATPCPPWCAYPAGHQYESVTHTGRLSRFHNTDVAVSRDREHLVAIVCEGLANGLRPERTSQPRIELALFGEGVEDGNEIARLTASEARELARFLHDGLMRAAARLDEIELRA